MFQYRDHGLPGILTDPSYAGQIVTFTFRIGNVGTNIEDTETSNFASRSGRGCVLRANITDPSNYRSAEHLDTWLKARGIIGITGIDTRALTALIRERGMPNARHCHEPSGKFDLAKMKADAKEWPGPGRHGSRTGSDRGQSYTWDETRWAWGKGYGATRAAPYHVVAIDYGVKRNILRCLVSAGCKVTVVPATEKAEEVLRGARTAALLVERPGRSGGDR